MLINNFIEVVTYALWILFAFFVIVYFLGTARRRGFLASLRELFRLRWPVIILLILIAITVIKTSAIFVEPQEVGVVISILSPEGYRSRPFRSGLHLLYPLLEQVQKYPISFQTYTMSSNPTEGQKQGDDSIKARTSDGQEVSLDCTLIFQIDPDNAVRIHIDWQGRYVEDFVRPVMRGLVRTLVSQYKADEVNSSKRLDLERDINKQMRDIFEEKGFTVDRFILRNISFSPEYSLSIETKQVALQGIVESEHRADQVRRLAQGEADAILTKAQADADATRIRAAAESESLKLIADGLAKDKNLLIYRYIEKLSPAIRAMLVPNNAPFILPTLDFNFGEQAPPAVSPSSATATPTPTATRPVTGAVTPTPIRTPTPGR